MNSLNIKALEELERLKRFDQTIMELMKEQVRSNFKDWADTSMSMCEIIKMEKIYEKERANILNNLGKNNEG